jgi:hypothetical protein
MKSGKRPTRAQKIFIELRGLNPSNWFVERETSAELVIMHRQTGTIKRFPKAG